jgi:hypothetical protein
MDGAESISTASYSLLHRVEQVLQNHLPRLGSHRARLPPAGSRDWNRARRFAPRPAPRTQSATVRNEVRQVVGGANAEDVSTDPAGPYR